MILFLIKTPLLSDSLAQRVVERVQHLCDLQDEVECLMIDAELCQEGGALVPEVSAARNRSTVRESIARASTTVILHGGRAPHPVLRDILAGWKGRLFEICCAELVETECSPVHRYIPLEISKGGGVNTTANACSLTAIRCMDMFLDTPRSDEEGVFRSPVALVPAFSAEQRNSSPIYQYFNPRYSWHCPEGVMICSLSGERMLNPMVRLSLEEFLSNVTWWDIRQFILSPEQPELLLWVGLAQSLGIPIVLPRTSDLLDSLGQTYQLLSMDTLEALDDTPRVFQRDRSNDAHRMRGAISAVEAIVNSSPPGALIRSEIRGISDVDTRRESLQILR